MHKPLRKQLVAQFYRGNRAVFALAVFAALAGSGLTAVRSCASQSRAAC